MPVGEKQHLEGLMVSVGFHFFFLASSRWSLLPLCPCALWLTDTASTVLRWGDAAAAAGSRESRKVVPHQPRHFALQPAAWQDKIIRSPDYLQCPASTKHRVALAEASASRGRKQPTQIINSKKPTAFYRQVWVSKPF